MLVMITTRTVNIFSIFQSSLYFLNIHYAFTICINSSNVKLNNNFGGSCTPSFPHHGSYGNVSIDHLYVQWLDKEWNICFLNIYISLLVFSADKVLHNIGHTFFAQKWSSFCPVKKILLEKVKAYLTSVVARVKVNS